MAQFISIKMIEYCGHTVHNVYFIVNININNKAVLL